MNRDLVGELVRLEQKFGGMHTGVPRDKVSPHDPRTAAELRRGGMSGGDRMGHHGYAPIYAEALMSNERARAALAERLRKLETRYAGGFTKVPPPRSSARDTVPAPKSVFDGHRMQAPGGKNGNRGRAYAGHYARELGGRKPLVLVELGILRGVGLAIWCDLFPKARVIGLDVDTGHFTANLGDLQRRGAFTKNHPEVHEFDELAPDAGARLLEILGEDDRIDVLIDDALHYDAAIVQAARKLTPLMAPGGVYFVEDNKTVHRALAAALPAWTVEPHGALTVMHRA